MLLKRLTFEVILYKHNNHEQQGGHVASELTEKDLQDSGFTNKQLSRLKGVLSRDENANETLSTLVDDLSKRFYGGVICLVLILTPLIFLPSSMHSLYCYITYLLQFWRYCGLVSHTY